MTEHRTCHAMGLTEHAAEASTPGHSQGPAAAQRKKLNCRVLVAEDGWDNRHLVSFILKKAGAEVAFAENGQVAVEKALAGRSYDDDTGPFDVILMDMQMPVMDGYTATRRLRSLGYTGPIIALTAHSMTFDRQKCIDAGCDDYLVKPIDRELMLATISEYADAYKRITACSLA